MENRIITDTTLIIPDFAPPLLKLEDLEAKCSWSSLQQEEDMLLALGNIEFNLQYTTLCGEIYQGMEQEELLEALNAAANNPKLTLPQHRLKLCVPMELCETVCTDGIIQDLHLCTQTHTIISPYALEISMEFVPYYAPVCEPEIIESCEEEKPIEQEVCEEMQEIVIEEEELCSCAEEQPQAEKAIIEAVQEELIEECGEEPCEEICEEVCENPKQVCEEAPRCNSRYMAFSVKPRPQREKSSSSCYCIKYYRVREGENLWSIAEKLQVSATSISRQNDLAEGEVQAGMLLIIPAK